MWTGLPAAQTLEALEYRCYDARFAARGRVVPASRDKIAIVGIDQASLNHMGQWPWPRQWHAALIKRLKQAGARVIVLDINFSDYQMPPTDPRTGKPRQDPASGKAVLSENDKALVAAARAAGNVVLPASLHFEKKTAHGARAAASFTQAPFEELDAETADVALNFDPPDPDGSVRRYVLRGVVSGAELGSVATLATAMFQHNLDGDKNTAYYKALANATWLDVRGVNHHLPLTPLQAQEDTLWTTPIYYWGPPGSFATYSYSDVFSPEGSRLSEAELHEKINGRMVFVGATADELKDLFTMPVFAVAGEDVTRQIPGVEIHASVAAMLLGGRYLNTVSTATTLCGCSLA